MALVRPTNGDAGPIRKPSYYGLFSSYGIEGISLMKSRRRSLKPTCIDLFAGVGGLSTGLELSGFEVLYANEIVAAHAAALQINHPNTELEVGDIRQVNPRIVRKKLGLAVGELTLLAGGPPCQGFSINAPIRSADDERNNLFLDYLKFAKEFKPRAILIENVPGMLSYNSGSTVRDILQSLKDLGYNPSVKILYAPHYGIPQMRWRTVFLATRDEIDPAFLFPAPTCKAPARANFGCLLDGDSLVLTPREVERVAKANFTTVADAISDLPEIPNGEGTQKRAYEGKPKTAYQKILRQGSELLMNHVCAGLGKANLDRLPHIPPGGSWRDIPFDILPAGMKRARRSDHTKRYGRLHPDGLASTILTKCDPHWGTYIHYTQDRVLSVREAARIQSFPDRINFVGSLSEQYEQVGNAVPPLLGKAIGERILTILDAFTESRKFPDAVFTGQMPLAF